MDQPIKVTIGICAYNTEQYIEQCLRSAMEQTYGNLEILVIDDGSTDGTGAFLDGISDKRVQVRHKQNEGLAAGREQIIQWMTGDAVYWLDSDDYLHPNAVADSVSLMIAHRADVVKTTIFPWEAKLSGVYTGEEYLRTILRLPYGHNVIGCLIRKELYKGVHHKIGYTAEDYYIFPRLIERADRIVVVNSGSYGYREMRPGGITYKGRNSFRGMYPRSVHRFDRYERYKEKYPEECRTLLKEVAHYTCMACLLAGNDPRAGECREILAKVKNDVMASEEVSRYEKWLTRAILRSSRILPAVSLFYYVKGHARSAVGDVVKGRVFRNRLQRSCK